MKNFLILGVLFIMITSCSDSSPDGTTNDGENQELQRITDSLTNYYRTQRNIPEGGFLLKIISPSKNYFVSSGISPEPTPNSHIRIASLTKTFTAAAIMLLYQQGKINIYDTINGNMTGTDIPYLPNSSGYNIPYKNQITIEQLLQHRAGVFDVTNTLIPNDASQPYAGKIYTDYVMELVGNEYHTFTFDELIGVVADNNLSYFPPGQEYHYSNTGYNILGKIIERASGETYSDFINNQFLIPLALTNTTSVWNGTDIDIPVPLIESFLYEDGSKTNTTKQNMSPHVSEGNIISTSDDITKWMKALFTGQAGINMTNVQKMEDCISTGNGGYGLGVSCMDNLGYGHNGAHYSFISIDFYNPQNDITVLVSANFWDMSDIYSQIGGMTEFAALAEKKIE